MKNSDVPDKRCFYDSEILLSPEDSAAENQLCFSWQLRFPKLAAFSLAYR
jgi:hypothetical protein